MAAAAQKPKLIAIVGPTASGKSELALKIAKQFNGEIIAADSRTIYRGMDIGTAKPTPKERSQVPHWGLDLIDPGQRYTAHDFRQYADQKIASIQRRGRLPILVGGTGLYIDAVLFDFVFGPNRRLLKRKLLERMNISMLQALIKIKSYPMPKNTQNKRHLVRTIETRGRQAGSRQEPQDEVYIIGILPEAHILQERISERAEGIFSKGIISETARLIKKYGKNAIKKSAGIVYKIAIEVLEGKIGEQEALELFKTADWQYARRQRTWFKRNPHIHWFEDGNEAFTAVTQIMNT